MPDVVAALDLSESIHPTLADLGRSRLDELADGVEPSWQRRPERRRSLRPRVPSGAVTLRPHLRRPDSAAADAVWDDRAEQDARGLVALLYVAGGMRRSELSEMMGLPAGRIDRACAFLHVSPPHGLALLDTGDRLVSAPDCGPLIERFLKTPAPEALSQAALEVLAIVAYEQPVTRADIRQTRGTESSGVIETLLGRGLIGAGTGHCQLSENSRQWCAGWLEHLAFVTPDTVLRWHQQGWRLFWRWKSRSRGGLPHLSAEVRELIASMSRDNHLWGTERIRGELLKLGIVVSNRSVRRYRWRGPARSRGQTRRTFLRNHAHHLWAVDLLTVPTLTFKTLYVLVFIAHGRRELVHVNVTASPTAAWVWRQVIEATPWGPTPRHLLRDRDVVYGRDCRQRARRIGIDAIATRIHAPKRTQLWSD